MNLNSGESEYHVSTQISNPTMYRTKFVLKSVGGRDAEGSSSRTVHVNLKLHWS